MKQTWTWHNECRVDDRVEKTVHTDRPGLRFGTTGITVVLESGRYSVTHHASGKSLGFRSDKITKAKKYAELAAPLTDWHAPDADALEAARPTLPAELRALAAKLT